MASFDADFRPTERCFDMFQLEGRSKDMQEAIRLEHQHATLACESRGGGGGRDSRCGSRAVGRASNGLLSQIGMEIWNAIGEIPCALCSKVCPTCIQILVDFVRRSKINLLWYCMTIQ